MILNHMGISGCSLQLLDKDTIRKQSPTIDYNQRLFEQIEKQKVFSQFSIDGVFVPRIYSSGYEGDLFYADMEYINGKLFTEELERVEKTVVDRYVYIISSYIKYCKNTSSTLYDSPELKLLIKNKLLSLVNISKHRNFVEYLINYVDACIFESIPKTVCHGDLTFSNILFFNKNLYLLDFLDSYIESFVVDLVKLKQDLCYNWYLKTLKLPQHTELRIRQIFRYMWNVLEKDYAPIIHSDFFDIIDAVNFLRIEPYLNTVEQHHILYYTLRETKLYEKFNSSHDG